MKPSSLFFGLALITLGCMLTYFSLNMHEQLHAMIIEFGISAIAGFLFKIIEKRA